MAYKSVYFHTQDLDRHTCRFLMGKLSSLIADDLAQLVSNYRIPPLIVLGCSNQANLVLLQLQRVVWRFTR